MFAAWAIYWANLWLAKMGKSFLTWWSLLESQFAKVGARNYFNLFRQINQ
jgi:hypothetical protein